jgi:hypothetical protein
MFLTEAEQQNNKANEKCEAQFYEKINVFGSETKNAKRNLALSFFRSENN